MSESGTAEDVLWEFARAEATSKRFVHLYRQHLDPTLERAITADDRGSLNDFDRDRVAAAVLNVRWPVVLGPIRMATSWRYEDIPTTSLGDVRFVHMADFETVAPTRQISELAQGIRDGKKFPTRSDDGDWGEIADRRARDFIPEKMRGAVVLVSPDGQPPYLLIEGLTRSTAMVIRLQRGETVPATVRALIGTCPELASSRFY